MPRMADRPLDPRWPKLLSLSVHEFRTPVTVVAGYIRMLLKDRAGPLAEPQRRLLEEAEKSCGRLSALLAEVSDLSNLEAGTAPFNRQRVDLRELLRQAASELPPLPDRDVTVSVSAEDGPAPVDADAVRLRQALGSILAALRRELVTSDRLLVQERAIRDANRSAFEVVVGDEETIASIRAAAPDALPVFDEWRGGCGLSLAIARRVLNAHGGSIWSPPENRTAGALLVVPQGD
jgi:signal transduction histidine kinase